LRLVEILGKREQREDLLNVDPQVGIELLLLCEDARIFEMAEPDVERGERHPGSFRLDDPRRELPLELAQITRGTEHVLRRIEEIAYSEALRGLFGNLHESAYARFARRRRIPLRLLIGDRRQQSPFNARALLRVVEQAAVL